MSGNTSAEIDDLILAAIVGDARPGLLDQRRTRDFDGHTRQHGAGRVTDDSSHRLRIRERRQQRDDGREEQSRKGAEQSGGH